MVGGLQPVLRDIMQNTALNIDALSVAAVSLNTMLVMSTATSPRGQLIETNVLFGLTVWNSCPFFVFFFKATCKYSGSSNRSYSPLLICC